MKTDFSKSRSPLNLRRMNFSDLDKHYNYTACYLPYHNGAALDKRLRLYSYHPGGRPIGPSHMCPRRVKAAGSKHSYQQLKDKNQEAASYG